MKHFDTGYWILSDILYILEGGNLTKKKLIDNSGVIFGGSQAPLTFAFFVLADRG